MKRTDLLEALKRASPALATKDFIPALSCFAFDGKQVVAYDDIVGISLPCALPLEGCLHGGMLLGLTAASRSKEVELSASNNEVLVKAGKRSKLKLPLVPRQDFLFEMPDPQQATALPFSDGLRDGLRRTAVSLGTDPAHPWRLGVTAVFSSKSKLDLYSSDNSTLSHAVVQGSVPQELRGRAIVLPPRFCELVIAIAGKDKPKELLVHEDWLLARFSSGLHLFGKTIAQADPKQFQDTFAAMEHDGELHPIPKGFDLALERALVVLSSIPDKHTSFSAKGGKLRMNTVSPMGEVSDRFSFGSAQECAMTCSSEMLLRAIPHVDRFALLPGSCFMLASDDFTHLVSEVGA